MTAPEVTDRFRRSRDRGCAYLLDRIRPDGRVGDGSRGVAAYYKIPNAFVVSGATTEAARVCDWIRRHGITPAGDFGLRLPETISYYYLYYNAWVVIGEHRQGHFDLSRRGADFILTFRDAESGGFYSSSTERAATTLQDLWVVVSVAQKILRQGLTRMA